MKISASQSDEGKRLDNFLTDHLEETRSQIKKMIKAGSVLVNGQEPTVHRFLHEGDVVEIVKQEIVLEDLTFPEIPVIYHSDDVMAIEKPAGILVHPAESAKKELTITDWITEYHPDIAQVGDAERPGIVHRLDRDTSGVLLIAKTQTMYNHLKKQFHDREIKKVYTALVYGHFHKPKGLIDKPIGRSTRLGRMAARTEAINEKDREAQTKYQVVQSYMKFDLVHAMPLTGRTHQIRVHLMAEGHPIVGDKIYKHRLNRALKGLERQFLHANRITFSDLEGNDIVVESPLPMDLLSVLQTLKK